MVLPKRGARDKHAVPALRHAILPGLHSWGGRQDVKPDQVSVLRKMPLCTFHLVHAVSVAFQYAAEPKRRRPADMRTGRHAAGVPHAARSRGRRASPMERLMGFTMTSTAMRWRKPSMRSSTRPKATRYDDESFPRKILLLLCCEVPVH